MQITPKLKNLLFAKNRCFVIQQKGKFDMEVDDKTSIPFLVMFLLRRVQK